MEPLNLLKNEHPNLDSLQKFDYDSLNRENGSIGNNYSDNLNDKMLTMGNSTIIYDEDIDLNDNYKHFYIDKSTINKTESSTGEKNQKKAFFVKKVKKPKKKGRKKKFAKNSHKPGYQYKSVHTKFSQDNILQKIKSTFIQSSMDFINRRYINYLKKNGKNKGKLLKKVKSEFSSKAVKDIDLKFLQTKLKDLFSSPLSERCSNTSKNFNKEHIKELYKKNEAKDTIEIFEKTVEELMKNYVNGDYEEEGFFVVNDLDIKKKKMKENEEEDIDNYVDKYLETAKNFDKIIKNKRPKKKRVNISIDGNNI